MYCHSKQNASAAADGDGNFLAAPVDNAAAGAAIAAAVGKTIPNDHSV